MKAFLRITLLFASLFTVAVTASMAQRVIKGTVYMDGEPAAGITVEVHRGGSMMTSFDGLYEVEADSKSKWIKFVFIDETKKLDLDENSGDKIDFAFTGKIPSGIAEEESGVVSLKSAEELIAADDKDFKEMWSLYFQFFKQDDYKSSLPYWKKIYAIYPKASLNIYIHGIKMYESFIENAKTDAEKDKYLDELMKIYDKRIKYFNQNGYLLGRKGTALLEYKLHENRSQALEGEELKAVYKKAYEWLNVAIKEQANKTEIPILILYMQTTRALFKLGEIPKETVVINYEKCNTVINSVIDENADNVENAKIAQPYIEKIFGASGAADCEALVSILTPQFQEKSEDVEFIKRLLRRLRRANCDESELVEQATQRLYELEPSAEAAFNMARRYLKKNDIEKAKGYYKQAMEQETDQDLLATYYYEYGLFIFVKENALSEARNYARKALAINSDYCEANMLIGRIYVEATRTFEGSALEKSAVFWIVVDYFEKARHGEDCSMEAAPEISKYKKYFPNKEEAFMENLKAGQTYKVGGWINENTKVRF